MQTNAPRARRGRRRAGSLGVVLTVALPLGLAGCRDGDAGIELDGARFAISRLGGKPIQACARQTIERVLYRGRALEIERSVFAQIQWNVEPEAGTDSRRPAPAEGRRISLGRMIVPLDLTDAQWRPVFAAWFRQRHDFGAAPLQIAEVRLGSVFSWQISGVSPAQTGAAPHYWRAYLLPRGRRAVLLQSEGWRADEKTRCNRLVDDLAANYDP